MEAANGPTASEADDILAGKGVLVVPDILANAGGVVVSYFEWVQNIQSVSWTEETVNEKLKNIMDPAFEAVWDISHKNNGTLRTGGRRGKESKSHLAVKNTRQQQSSTLYAFCPHTMCCFRLKAKL